MKCPNCGNEIYERLDFAIVRCTDCLSLWDPYVYPGFPEPDVDIGEIWDTTPSVTTNLITEEEDLEDDSDDWEDEEEDEEVDYDDEFDDWDEDEDDDQEDDY
jgi:hypothetical protein